MGWTLAFILAQALDVASSCKALQTPGVYERNRLLPRSCMGITAVKMGVTAGSIAAVEHIPSKRTRIVLYIAGTAATGYAVTRNLHTIRTR